MMKRRVPRGAASIGVVLTLWAPGGIATAKEAEAEPQVWLNPGFMSRHFNRDKGYREDNPGLGAEVVINPDHTLLAGSFINSDRARSRYGVYQWRPWHWDLYGLKLNAGVAAGAFDGYPRYQDGGWFVAALPLLSLEGERFGMNLTVMPNIPNRISGAVVVQFKFRLW